MKRIFTTALGFVTFFQFCGSAFAWDYEGHRVVNLIALSSLPTNFPQFVQTPAARERIAFLAGEPDRWRNTSDLPLKHYNHPDHFIDMEDIALHKLNPDQLSKFRYEFAGQLAAARPLYVSNFPPVDPGKNADRTQGMIGFAPWAITEYYAKLKSAFSYLKVFEELGTPEEIANAQQNIIYLMGVMGHYVGDLAQPLHTTRNYNGWVDANPHGYTTSRSFRENFGGSSYTFHSWIDGGYIRKVGLDKDKLFGRVRPAKSLFKDETRRDDVFAEVMMYVGEQHKLVEPLYRMEKEGKLSGDGEVGLQGREFLSGQILKGGQMLGDLWFTAWQHVHPDTYLRKQLSERKLAETSKPASQ